MKDRRALYRVPQRVPYAFSFCLVLRMGWKFVGSVI